MSENDHDIEIPSKRRELTARELGEAITGHVLNEADGAADIERACERLDALEDEEREDSVTTLTCSNCGNTIPGLYWTELDMEWRCPRCQLRIKRNDGVKR